MKINEIFGMLSNYKNDVIKIHLDENIKKIVPEETINLFIRYEIESIKKISMVRLLDTDFTFKCVEEYQNIFEEYSNNLLNVISEIKTKKEYFINCLKCSTNVIEFYNCLIENLEDDDLKKVAENLRESEEDFQMNIIKEMNSEIVS